MGFPSSFFTYFFISFIISFFHFFISFLFFPFFHFSVFPFFHFISPFFFHFFTFSLLPPLPSPPPLRIRALKINREENPADTLASYSSAKVMLKHVRMMGCEVG